MRKTNKTETKSDEKQKQKTCHVLLFLPFLKPLMPRSKSFSFPALICVPTSFCPNYHQETAVWNRKQRRNRRQKKNTETKAAVMNLAGKFIRPSDHTLEQTFPKYPGNWVQFNYDIAIAVPAEKVA